MRRLGSVKSGIKMTQLRTIFQSFVLPALEYAAPAWYVQVLTHNNGLAKLISKRDRLAKLIVTGLNPSTPYSIVDIECSIPSPILRVIALGNNFVLANWECRRSEWTKRANDTHEYTVINRLTRCAILSKLLPQSEFTHFQNLLPQTPLSPLQTPN
jgi:hypothetical protein